MSVPRRLFGTLCRVVDISQLSKVIQMPEMELSGWSKKKAHGHGQTEVGKRVLSFSSGPAAPTPS